MGLLDAFGRPLQREERQDAWVNPQTGLGVIGLDKTKGASYLPVWRILDQELTNLYNGSDLAAKIVSKRVEEMMRRGFEVECDDVKASENDDLREYATEYLELEQNLREGKRWGRLYGGCLLVLGIDDGRNPWEPVDEGNVRSFDSISLVDRRYSYVQSQYAAMNGPRYGKPEVYLISNAVAGYGWNSYGAQIGKVSAQDLKKSGAQVSLVHETRVIRFDGHAADIVTRQNLAGWSWSVLQRVYDAMRQFEGAFDSAGYLLSDASQGVFKLQGLMKAISSGNQGALAGRLQIMEQTRSVLRAIALDAGGADGKNSEDFQRQQTPFGGIPELLDRFMGRFAAAADMPQTELFGRAPAGLNATGESDTRKWYDSIESEAQNDLGPQIRRVFRLLALAKKGPLKGRDCKFKVHFKPLWSPTDKELAETRLANAQRDAAYIDQGVVKPEEVAVDLVDVYPNLDVEAREEVLAAGLKFEPYENEPAPDNAAAVNAAGQGEPLSPKAPVPLMGTSGTQIDPGALPAVAASESASKGAAGRDPDKSAAQKAKQGLDAREDEAGATVNLPDAALCIVWNKRGQILCVTRPEPPHEMSIPGGHVEPGETWEQAAVRELREETGIEVLEARDEGKLSIHPNAQVVRVFTALRWKGRARAREPRSQVAWLTPDALFKQSVLYRRGITEMQGKGLLSPSTGMSITRSSEDRADAAAMLVIDAISATRRDGNAMKAVFEQLLKDYHAKDLGWVTTLDWSDPTAVPLAEINFASRDRWRASTDGTLKGYIDNLRKGRIKPIILVSPPDALKEVVDGHHRTLASEALERPVVAYVAHVPQVEGPWLHLHSLQKKGSSKVPLEPGESSRDTSSRLASREETSSRTAISREPPEA